MGLKRRILGCFTFLFITIFSARAMAVEYPFIITTTPDTSEFSFTIDAAGTFYIDWGDGDTETIEKTNTNNQTISHTYTSAKSYTIKLGGKATRYNNQTIGFYKNLNLAKIEGSLGAIFSTLSDGSQPTFTTKLVGSVGSSILGTFQNCTNLTSIPESLFTGISGAPAENMFYKTFAGCSGLTSIPGSLFAGIEGKPAKDMFSNTFFGCSGLTSIPKKLFAGITGTPAEHMFSSTFSNCTGLTSIPENLFSGITGTPAERMFANTFSGCSNLSGPIPQGLFGNLTGSPASNMFASTFEGCLNLSGPIPQGLFGNLTGSPAERMFSQTFYGCSNLSGPIPQGLFGNLTGSPASSMFANTFRGCSKLSGPIPQGLFGNLTGSPAERMFTGTFSDCSNLSGPIQQGLFGNLTGSPAEYMFASTFSGCSKLSGSIQPGLFGDLTGSPAEHMFTSTFSGCSNLSGPIPQGLFGNLTGSPAKYMFASTFSGCSNLSGSIQPGLFGDLTGSPAEHMFASTFSGCSNLSGPIPQGLFGNLTGSPAEWMFTSTFSGCSKLSGSIPQGLFGNLTGNPAKYMFSGTFSRCSNLESFIPPTLFAGIDTPDVATANGQMSSIFYNSGIVTQCPVGYYQYMTGFEKYFNERVSCTPCPARYTNAGPGLTSESQCAITVEPGYYIATPDDTTPTQCPSGSYCAGGNVPYGQTGPINTCPTNSSSEPGASVCTCDNGFINNGGTTTTTDACIPDYKFFMTTTPDTSEFSFTIDAAGTFYIDWGDGKTETIKKAHIGEQTVSHTYSNADEYIIKLGGQATGYGNDMAISFYRNKKLSRLDGCLGAIFSTLSNGSQPRFGNAYDSTINQYYGAFTDCINLTQIPGTLFTTFDTNGSIIRGINGAPIPYMFAYTFSGCSGLTSIPDRLFAGLIGEPADYMFFHTFGHFSYYGGTPYSSNCSNITGSIPENLFAGIKGTPAEWMFAYTFEGCSGLTGSIPENLFAGIEGEPAEWMFAYTFSNCSGLSGSIPENLFAGIEGEPASSMFDGTFWGCSNLSGPIPQGLFGNLTGSPASSMFDSTFYGCSGLTGSIPENLFAGIEGEPASGMFDSTFYGCSNLSGPIPQGLFGNISGNVKDLMFNGTFYGCSNLSGSIPAGLFGNLSGTPQYSMFKDTFSGCSGLTGSIPAGLFGNLSGAPFAFMFEGTFKDCSNLTGSIPDDLFSNISGAPQYKMFDSTFAGCSNLESFIPPTLFAGIDTPDVATAYGQMSSIFNNSGIVTQCPVGYYQYMTGFEEYFDSRVSCTPCPTGYTNAGPGLTSESQCAITVEPGYYIKNPGDTEPTKCPNGSYCTGGDVPYGQTGPINTCPAIKNLYGALDAAVETPDGLDSIDQCMGGYSFAEKFFADTLVGALGDAHKDYDPESNANKRGTYLVFCNYNSETDNYDIDCTGISLLYGCANGHYFSNTEQVDWSQFPTDENAAISTDTLEQAIEQVCAETDIDHWSPGLQDCYDKYTSNDDINKCIEPKVLPCINSTDDNCPLKTLWSQHPCPENSSTRGLTGQEYCTCDDKYTVDGTANGPTTTMYDACIRAEVTITYDVNGGNGAIESHKCLAYDTCDIKTPSQIGHDMYRPGYVFDGWALNPGDTTPIDYQYTFNDNTTVYAIWTPCANGTYKTADANADEQCSACSDLGTEYTFSEIASTSANQCRTECLEHSIIYGTAIPLEQYKFWPNKCEYRGVSVTGNPCDIIDGECIETSCNYNYEMINGRCQACNREHALTYKPTGNCVVETCGYGYHADGQYCVGDTKECSATNAISAHQVWDTKKNAFSECLITECESGYHVSENVCQLDDQTCELEHGTGEREWDDKTNSWGKCVATYCEPGYTNDPSLTNENWEQCGRCNNMYTTDGIMAVSSYIQGCEIASCMNQGEQFILDGDECRLICDEYSDETGRRYWDGKKCVHECTNGYTQW